VGKEGSGGKKDIPVGWGAADAKDPGDERRAMATGMKEGGSSAPKGVSKERSAVKFQSYSWPRNRILRQERGERLQAVRDVKIGGLRLIVREESSSISRVLSLSDVPRPSL